jgi:hypothetical protein
VIEETVIGTTSTGRDGEEQQLESDDQEQRPPPAPDPDRDPEPGLFFKPQKSKLSSKLDTHVHDIVHTSFSDI